MDEYAVYTIFKVKAKDADEAQATVGNVIATIPEEHLVELEDVPYTLKVERQ